MRNHHAKWLVGIALVVALVGCGVPNFGSLPLQSGSPPASTIQTNGRTRGNPNAPVTLVEYSDYQ
jgi:protein-disulfide isomerase